MQDISRRLAWSQSEPGKQQGCNKVGRVGQVWARRHRGEGRGERRDRGKRRGASYLWLVAPSAIDRAEHES